MTYKLKYIPFLAAAVMLTLATLPCSAQEKDLLKIQQRVINTIKKATVEEKISFNGAVSMFKLSGSGVLQEIEKGAFKTLTPLGGRHYQQVSGMADFKVVKDGVQEIKIANAKVGDVMDEAYIRYMASTENKALKAEMLRQVHQVSLIKPTYSNYARFAYLGVEVPIEISELRTNIDVLERHHNTAMANRLERISDDYLEACRAGTSNIKEMEIYLSNKAALYKEMQKLPYSKELIFWLEEDIVRQEVAPTVAAMSASMSAQEGRLSVARLMEAVKAYEGKGKSPSLLITEFVAFRKNAFGKEFLPFSLKRFGALGIVLAAAVYTADAQVSPSAKIADKLRVNPALIVTATPQQLAQVQNDKDLVEAFDIMSKNMEVIAALPKQQRDMLLKAVSSVEEQKKKEIKLGVDNALKGEQFKKYGKFNLK